MLMRRTGAAGRFIEQPWCGFAQNPASGLNISYTSNYYRYVAPGKCASLKLSQSYGVMGNPALCAADTDIGNCEAQPLRWTTGFLR